MGIHYPIYSPMNNPKSSGFACLISKSNLLMSGPASRDTHNHGMHLGRPRVSLHHPRDPRDPRSVPEMDKNPPNVCLVGGWTNPSEKYVRQKGFIFPTNRGENMSVKPPPSCVRDRLPDRCFPFTSEKENEAATPLGGFLRRTREMPGIT